MYKLQRKKWPPALPKRYIFFSKLVGLSVGIHVVGLCCVFMGIKNNSTLPLHVVFNRQSLPTNFVVLPFVKKIPGALVALQEQSKKGSSSGGATKQKQAQKSHAAVVEKTNKSAPKKSESKQQTMLVEKKEAPSKKASKKQEQECAQQKKSNKSNKKIEPPKAEKKPIRREGVLAKNGEEQVHEAAQNAGEQEVIYLGRDDFAALVSYEKIQQHIETTWRPPVGVSRDCACSVKVTLDDQGGIRELAIEESSHVLPYDIAARAALEQAPFPKEMWGKNIVITFKQ